MVGGGQYAPSRVIILKIKFSLVLHSCSPNKQPNICAYLYLVPGSWSLGGRGRGREDWGYQNGGKVGKGEVLDHNATRGTLHKYLKEKWW